MSAISLLLIDDDRALCELLTEFLNDEGFLVTACYDGQTGLTLCKTHDFALIILDAMLPKLSGFEFLPQLRSFSRCPILMLTARGEEVDRIIGLELGADDYLAKPAHPRELVARLRAILRRTQPVVEEKLQYGDIRLDPAARQGWCGEQRLELTGAEFGFLEYLLRHVGQIVSKAELSEQVLNRKLGRFDRNIDVHISNLRRKLGPLSDGEPRIQAVRGVGYLLVKR